MNLHKFLCATLFFMAEISISNPITDEHNFFLKPNSWMCSQPGPLVLVADSDKLTTRGIDCQVTVIKPKIVAVMDVDLSTGLSYVCRNIENINDKRFQDRFFQCGYTYTLSIMNENGESPKTQELIQIAQQTNFEKVKKLPRSAIGCLVDQKANFC